MQFSGPLFIVGMPRSGTKLLRDLLNQSNEVCIPPVETHFIPGLVDRFENTQNIFENQESFYRYFTNSSFYQNMVRMGYSMTEKDLQTLNYSSWNTFIKDLLNLFLDKDEYTIWGDKSPSYLTQIQRLDSIFTDARFIHILRDPRDYVLSCQTIWGKNVFRAAAKWKQNVLKASNQSSKLGERYLQLSYEELLADSSSAIKKTCHFLGIEYSEKLLRLDNPLEEVDSTKGKNYIVSSNTQKYKKGMKPKDLLKVEQLTFPALGKMGYKYENEITKEHHLGSLQKSIYVLQDVLNKLKYHRKQRGLFSGLKYYLRVGFENIRNQKG